jgi:SWI/SNF-related matrix-associated actin-dependent regulator 1 of chromatin subfamily A
LPKLSLRPFQAEDVALIRKHNYNVLVANAPGTGKTIEVLACVLQDPARLTPALIVCPSSVVTNWCREARKWLGAQYRIHAIKNRSRPLPRKRAHIMVVPWALLAEREAELRSYGFRLLVADEAHFGKNPEALRSQALMEIAKKTPHKLLLTGTPIINSSTELEAIHAYFGDGGPPCMIRRLLEDVAPDIPPKTRSRVYVQLRRKDRERYRKLNEDFSNWLEQEMARRLAEGEARAAAARALAAEALVKVGYLRRLLGEAKVYAAADWASRAVRLGEPVVLFAEHQEVIRRVQVLLRRQRIGCVVIDGSTSRKNRQKAIDDFQAGKVPVFIGSKAAKEGITLVRARNLMFLERYFTGADEDQAEDRIRRIGQLFRTTIWQLHATETIDDRMAEIVDMKRELVREAIGAEDIADHDEAAVAQLVEQWSRHVEPAKAKPTKLGLGKPLPALPNPAETCQVIFRGSRWSASTSRAWMRMHGYSIIQMSEAPHRVQAWHHPASRFVHGTFTTVDVASDVQVIVGKVRAESTRTGKRQASGARR